MAKIKVHSEEVFRAQKDQFMVAATTGGSGYQVAYSADGTNFTNDEQAVVPAGENLLYLGAMQYGYYKLVGNTEDLDVLV